MVKLLKDVNLGDERLEIFDFLLLYRLDGKLLLRLSILGQVDQAKAS